MKFGVCIPNYGDTLSADGMRTVALEAERLGYDSVWTTDHILMPSQSGTPYERIFDSIASLAYLAPLTSKVKLGISSLIMAMRDPVVVAKQLATIDNLSGGRIMLCTSSGWNRNEFTHLGADFHTRGPKLNESIRLIRTLWENPEAQFEGKRLPHRFSKAIFEPRPVQKKLTIWIGGTSSAAMKRAAKYGDAWHPNVYPLETFSKLVSEFRKMPGGENKSICVRIGLNTKATSSLYTGPQGDRRVILSGDMTENAKTLAELEKMGVSYAVAATNIEGKISTADQVESLKALARSFIKK